MDAAKGDEKLERELEESAPAPAVCRLRAETDAVSRRMGILQCEWWRPSVTT